MTDKELISKLDAMVKALQKAKKKTDKTSILLDARKDFGDEADELMAFFRFLLDPEIEMRAKQIEQLSNLKHFEILYQRYVMQKSMVAIADDMHYSYRHTINLHTQALEAFEAIYHNKRQESAEYGKI